MLNLRILVALIWLAKCFATNERRRLTTESTVMAGFQTTVDVTDFARIDLDQQFINRQVDLATQDAFENAKSVYELGAFSKSIATIELTQAIGTSISAGANVVGQSESGNAVSGVTIKGTQTSDTTIQMQYLSEGCNVGGLAASSPVTDGCLASDASFNIEGTSVQYTGYTATTDTFNGRSIQLFSTDAESRMKHPGSDTYYPDYDKFVQYYGSPSYADDIVQAAYLGRPTSLENGNIDFTVYDYVGRAEAVKAGTAYMATLMEVLAQVESALYECLKCNQDDCREDAIGFLDQAVALYTGSLEGASGTLGEGTAMYSLAERRGLDFLTSVTGQAKVNTDVMSQFNMMKNALSDGNCASARANKIQFAQLVFVPLIQSTI
ncbi:hypothetical protein MPSEU_000686900 [Mayamaea pseudoterrestris]|nr:hypothetical protein MPSEU_000686900 [Mayamaea pseudoterrestris]